jgi:hypothetical protein
VVTGDTKVVERGKADGAFLTTSGIGLLEVEEPIDPGAIEAGDQLVVSGDLGRHGMAILAARHGLDLHPPLESDCAPVATARLNKAMAGRSSNTETPTNRRPVGLCRAWRWASKRRVTPVPVADRQARQSRAVAGFMANQLTRGP